MSMTEEYTFASWLWDELNKRGWDQAQLVRRTGVSQSVISRIMSNSRKPGPESLRRIARALQVPEETAFRAAGLLGNRPEPLTPDLALMLQELAPADREIIIALMRRLLD